MKRDLLDSPVRVALSWSDGRMLLCANCIVCDAEVVVESTLLREHADYDRCCDCCGEPINRYLAQAAVVDAHLEIEREYFDEMKDSTAEDDA